MICGFATMVALLFIVHIGLGSYEITVDAKYPQVTTARRECQTTVLQLYTWHGRFAVVVAVSSAIAGAALALLL